MVDGRLDVPWAVARAVLGSILAATHRLRFEGLENIPASGGAVVSGNHISVLDPFVVGLAVAGLGRKIHFLTVTEVSDHPVAAWTLRTLDQVSIRREAGDRRTFNRFAALARGGALTGVFPEGRIGDGRRLLAPQKGAARVALSADVPVIPAGLWGTQERWPNTGLRLTRPLRPTVALVFGRPIVASGDPRCPGDVRALRDRIMREIEALASCARRLSAPPDGRVGTIRE